MWNTYKKFKATPLGQNPYQTPLLEKMDTLSTFWIFHQFKTRVINYTQELYNLKKVTQTQTTQLTHGKRMRITA